jgi:hypothetical protein
MGHFRLERQKTTGLEIIVGKSGPLV